MALPSNTFETLLTLFARASGLPHGHTLLLYGATCPSDPLTLLGHSVPPPGLPVPLTLEDPSSLGAYIHSPHIAETAPLYSALLHYTGTAGERLFLAILSPDEMSDALRSSMRATFDSLAPLLAAVLRQVRFVAYLERFPFVMLEVDQQGNIIASTPGLSTFVGEPEPLRGHIEDILPSYPRWFDLFTVVTQEAIPVSRDLLLATTLGVTRTRAWVQPSLDHAGRVTAFIIALLPQTPSLTGLTCPSSSVPVPSFPNRSGTVPEVSDSQDDLGLLIVDITSPLPHGGLDPTVLHKVLEPMIDYIYAELRPATHFTCEPFSVVFQFPKSSIPRLKTERDRIERQLQCLLYTLSYWPFYFKVAVTIATASESALGCKSRLLHGQLFRCAPGFSVLSHGLPGPRDIIRAIHERSFVFALQPIVSLRDGKSHRAELLTRLRVRNHHVSVSSLAQYDLFGDIVATMDLEALHTAVALTKRVSYPVHVNVSLQTITRRDFLDQVESFNDLSGLVLEIVEGWSLVCNFALAQRVIVHLRERGARFVFDDCGGTMPLALLYHLPVDGIKIDGTVINCLSSDPQLAHFLQALTRTAHDFGLEVIAEHVEDEQTLNIARSLVMDFAQGFLFGAPQILSISDK